MDCPLDYSLCDRAVTLYRREGNTVTRQVVEHAAYVWQDSLRDTEQGPEHSREFLLIIPGQADIRPGDRVYDGIGPETVAWQQLLPVTVPGLSQVAYVKPFYWEGAVCHTEAGRR